MILILCVKHKFIYLFIAINAMFKNEVPHIVIQLIANNLQVK